MENKGSLVTSWRTVNWSPASEPIFMFKNLIFSIAALSVSFASAQEPAELPSFRDVIERLDRNEEFSFRALDVIREELSKSRADRERLLGDVAALRELLNQSRADIAGLSGLFSIPGALEAAVGSIDARIRPLDSAITRLLERFDSEAVEAAAARKGLLEAFAEARAELVRARAEAQKQYAEAEKMRAQAQKELLEARGTLGSRLFWFSVSVTGSIIVLLVGLSIVIAVISKMASKITDALSIIKPL